VLVGSRPTWSRPAAYAGIELAKVVAFDFTGKTR
jgi:hypothetical protein